MRPVKYFKGVEAPNKRCQQGHMVIFRENTEDVYCGIEFKSGTDRAQKVIDPAAAMGYGWTSLLDSAGIGIKPI